MPTSFSVRPITAIVIQHVVAVSGLLCAVNTQPAAAADRPNIVIMLADDMGFGELQCLNPTRGKIKTPQLDAIAAGGMIFTDAHSGSSVCTPTRYGLMTGRYAWRTRLQQGVLTGGQSLIAEDRLTVAKFLHATGYHTAVIGKWHLGMLFDGQENSGDVPVGATVTHGPIDRGGFDEFHGFHHARQIKTWIDNDRVTAELEPIEMLPRLTQTAVDYIHGRQGNPQPFLLYIPWSSPHSPVVPSPAWQGKSGLNEHADFVMQTDDSFGQVVAALRETGQLDNTLIICSSDNGTSAPTSKMSQLQKLGHFPSGDLRGSKADIWDGGHRVPFIVSWPQHVAPNTRSGNLVCLTDVLATIADVVDQPLPSGAAEDSFSFLPTLRGTTDQGNSTPARRDVIHHSVSGYFAIRQDNWKLCLCPDSGGWTDPKPTAKSWSAIEQAGQSLVQLYDMTQDIGEQTNQAQQHPQVVERLLTLLRQQVSRGRTTPGPEQANDVDVTIDKRPGKADPSISLWYGDHQRFGHLGGHPQRWINILGSVKQHAAISSLTFRLNDGIAQPLSFHEDNKRIARDGDFNVEIARSLLRDGENIVTIEARTSDDRVASQVVNIDNQQNGLGWPIPYVIDWSQVKRIDDAVQITDGKWKLTKHGIRSVQRYYDRAVALGDASWHDYEVATTLTVHGLTAPKSSPNTTGVTHAAIALRWPGHDADGNQPTVKWHPLGATGEFRLGGDLQQCRWRIFDGQRDYYRESPTRRVLEFERPYAMKHRVETLADGSAQYRAKLWPAGESEPTDWDLVRIEAKDDVPVGSALLLAHHSDVTFGNVSVIPLGPSH